MTKWFQQKQSDSECNVCLKNEIIIFGEHVLSYYQWTRQQALGTDLPICSSDALKKQTENLPLKSN